MGALMGALIGALIERRMFGGQLAETRRIFSGDRLRRGKGLF